jgi:PhzF family phenazine biosynthesis protein
MKVRVLRAFTDESLQFGNPLGLIEEASQFPDPMHRQALAAALGYSETAFIDDAETSAVRFYSPHRAVPFAGHAAVGAAWALSQPLGRVPEALQTGAGSASVWVDQSVTWVQASLATAPRWWHEKLPTADAVEALDGPLSRNKI